MEGVSAAVEAPEQEGQAPPAAVEGEGAVLARLGMAGLGRKRRRGATTVAAAVAAPLQLVDAVGIETLDAVI